MYTQHCITVPTTHTMTRSRARAYAALSLWRWVPVLLALLALVTYSGHRDAHAEADITASALTLQRLGTPCFRPVDFHLFSADITDFLAFSLGQRASCPRPNTSSTQNWVLDPGCRMTHRITERSRPG
jgi:hypothetical protein